MPSLVIDAGLREDSGWSWSLVPFRGVSAASVPPESTIRGDYLEVEFSGTCPDEWRESLVIHAGLGA